MIKYPQWRSSRKNYPVEVFIRTKDNPIGLNTLLWSLVGQTLLPEMITLFNTGRKIEQEEIFYALSFFKEVRILNRLNEDYLEDGVFSHSLQVMDCIRNFKKDLIWFFDDDLFVSGNCLEELSKKVPSVPRFVVEYEPFDFEDVNKVIHYGLLARKEDWSKVPKFLEKKDYPRIGEDCISNRIIKPFVNFKTYVFHTKSCSGLHKLIYNELHNQLWKGL